MVVGEGIKDETILGGDGEWLHGPGRDLANDKLGFKYVVLLD